MNAARHLPAALLILAVLIYPALFHSGFALGAAIMVAGLAIGAVGLVLLLGLAHQLAIGQAAFYMIGGYGSAILTTRYGWDGASAMVASVLCASAVAYVIGGPILRLRGFVLAIASLALQLLFIALAILLVGITGGVVGNPDRAAFLARAVGRRERPQLLLHRLVPGAGGAGDRHQH